VAALGAGLGSGNREYLEKLNANLIAYQDTARLLIGSSRIGCDTRAAIRRVEGVKEVGPIGFASVAVVDDDWSDPMDVSLIGVEPGKPGEPPVVRGQGLLRRSADEVIIDRTVALMTRRGVGDRITLRSTLGVEYEYYVLTIVGVSDSRKYGLRPSVFAPIVTWDRIRPKAAPTAVEEDPACNVVAVQLEDPADIEGMRRLLAEQVDRIETADLQTAYENTPGYSEQQSTLSAQNGFALLIGVLVIGGFFQIQTLQKVPQIGMLKAIGAPSSVVAVAAMIQIIVVTLFGVVLGSLASLGLSLIVPPNIPIVFELRSGALALAAIFLMGPLGGLVSIRYSLRVEPLIALGLDQ
jgi:putative ABC transport system permease protein